jgi:hypothetical protein
MSGRKLLIDTNVFIGLEDEREVAPEFATLQQLCAQHNVRIFIHERAADDIRRDRDAKRRAISFSKIRKFEQLKRVSEPPKADLEAKFGIMPKPNDEVDVALLHALDINAVDFLVTQDLGIHTRATRASPAVGNRVLTVSDAVAWLRASFASGAMQLGFECAVAQAIDRRQRFVEDGRGAAWIARSGFFLGQRNLYKAVEQQDVLCAQAIDGLTHVSEARADGAARRGRPTLEKGAECAPHRQLVLVSEPGKLEGVRCAASVVSTHQFEHGRLHSSKRERADMGAVRHPRLHTVDKRNRPIDLAERP